VLTRYTLLHHSPAFYTVVPWHLSFPRSLPSFSINVLFTQSYILVIHVLAFWGGHRNERGCLLFNFFFLRFLCLSIAERATADVYNIGIFLFLACPAVN